MKKENNFTCETLIIHDETVNMVRQRIPQPHILQYLAEFFKIFGDESRLGILYAVLIAKEICVCDIAAALNMSSSAVSHQLKILRQERLIKYRKSGKVVYYSLDDKHIEGIIEQGMQHISEQKT